jgi:hypothetical protein
MDDAQRKRSAVLRSSNPALKYRELISAKASDHVPVPDAAPETIGYDRQECVAHLMARGVVHILEVVEVEVEKRDGATLVFRSCEPLLQLLTE